VPTRSGVRVPRSRIDWILVVLYWAAAAPLIHEALTCTVWFCDLVEFWVALPFGAIYLLVLKLLDPVAGFGSITYAPFRNWVFIVPTLIANSVIYYWVGVGVAKLFAKLLGRQ